VFEKKLSRRKAAAQMPIIVLQKKLMLIDEKIDDN